MRYAVMFVAVVLMGPTGMAQGVTQKIQDGGEYHKFLTPGTLDRWIIQGIKGETFIAHIRTQEFDPVLELATGTEQEDKVLLSVDDDGSESWYAYRLPADGEYKIRVHGYEFKGGGNYSLTLRRFKATELKLGQRLVGSFDHQGRSYHYLQASEDQILTVSVRGAESWELLDVKGRAQDDWEGSIRCEQAGEYSLALTGKPGTRYEVTIQAAVQTPLALNEEAKGELHHQQMQVFNIQGEEGQFRLIEIKQTGTLSARLIHAPANPDKALRVAPPNRPPIRELRDENKGQYQRFAVILGRNDRYQIQLISPGDGSYVVQMSQPTVPIQVGDQQAQNLRVGSAAYFQFQAQPGQLIIARLTSEQFDPMLRLYDAHGEVLAENDDGDGGIGSRISYLVTKSQIMQLLVTSLGDGGGGKFELSLSEQKPQPLELGKVASGTLAQEAVDPWSFEGKQGQTVFFHVRSASFDPQVTIRDPDGVILGEDDNGGVDDDSLLALRLPRDGRYTVWVSSRRGQGDYQIRPINGD